MSTTDHSQREATAHAAGPGSLPELDGRVEKLLDDVQVARAAVAVYEGAPDATGAYAKELRSALDTMDRDLAMARTTLAAHESSTLDDVQEAVNRLAKEAQGWFDEIAVRSRLGRMDARDQYESVTHRIDQAATAARTAMARVSDAVESDMAQMRRLARHAVDEVRSAVRDASDALRDLDE